MQNGKTWISWTWHHGWSHGKTASASWSRSCALVLQQGQGGSTWSQSLCNATRGRRSERLRLPLRGGLSDGAQSDLRCRRSCRRGGEGRCHLRLQYYLAKREPPDGGGTIRIGHRFPGRSLHRLQSRSREWHADLYG